MNSAPQVNCLRVFLLILIRTIRVQHAGDDTDCNPRRREIGSSGWRPVRHTFNSWTPQTQRLALSFHRVRVFGRYAVAGYSNTGRGYQGFLILSLVAISPIPLDMTNEAFTRDLMRLQQALAAGHSSGRMSLNSTPPQSGLDYNRFDCLRSWFGAIKHANARKSFLSRTLRGGKCS